jgi:hypothetical protein
MITIHQMTDTDDKWVPALDDQGNQKNVDSYGYGFHAGGYTLGRSIKNNNPNDTHSAVEDSAQMMRGCWLVCWQGLDDGGGIQGCAH